MNGHSHVVFPEALELLAAPDHLCLICDSRTEQVAAVVPFIRIGLIRGEQCVYVADDKPTRAILKALRGRGIDADAALASGALIFVTRRDGLSKQGRFDADRIVRLLARCAKRTRGLGFSGIRIASEMDWMLGNKPGVENINRYESKLDRVVREHNVLAICVCDHRRLSPALVMGAIQTHPRVMYRGTICSNPRYVSTDALPGTKDDRRSVQRVLASLLEYERTEAEMRDSQSQYRTLFENVPVGVGVADREGNILALNNELLRQGGFDESDRASLKSVYQLYESSDDRREALERLKRDGFVRQYPVTFRRKDGSPYPALLTLRSIEFRGNPCILALIEDISERQRAEDAINERDRKFSTIFQKSSFAATLSTLNDGIIIDVNEAFVRLFGFERDEAVGKTSLDLSLYRDPQDRKRIVEELSERRHLHDVELTLYAKSGNPVVCLASISVMEYGGQEYLLTTAQEITRRKEAEEALKASEEKYRTVLERAPDGITIVQDGLVKFVNPTLAKMWGGKVQDILGTPVSNYVDPEEFVRPSGAFRRRMYRGSSIPIFETVLRRRNMEPVPVEVNATATEFEGRRAVLFVVRDMTERRQAEQRLELQSIALNAVANAVVITDRNGAIEWVNSAFTELTGYGPQEVIGKNPRILNSGHQGRDFYKRLWDTILAGKVWRGELVNKRKDGSLYYDEQTITPILDKEGKVTTFIAVKQNITTRREYERQREATFRIARAAVASDSLESLYKEVHGIIATIMPANNFYIALYNKESNLLTFPYFVDEVDRSTPAAHFGKGLTEYVLRTGRSLLCDQIHFDRLVESGDVELVGAPSPIWLGVPLVIKEQPIGVMVVQHYSDPRAYTTRDQQLLEFVSSEIAEAIERKRSERAIQSRDSILEAVSYAAHQFIRGEWNEVVPEVLQRFGQATEVSRVYIFDRRLSETGESLVNQRYEWVGPGIPHQIDNPELQNFPLVSSGFGRWEEQFLRHEPVYGDIHTFPTSEQEILSAQDIESLAVVPIFAGSQLWGFIGFDQCYRPKIWHPVEIEALRAAATILGDAILSQRTQASLEREEEYFRQLFQGSPMGTVMLTKDRKLLTANHAFEKMFQYSQDELRGKDIDSFLVPNELSGEAMELSNKALANQIVQKETQRQRKDGSIIDVSFTGYPIILEGEVVGLYGKFSDITVRKRLEEQFRQAQKMESLGTLAGGIAHDMNNILGILLGHAMLLESDKGNPGMFQWRLDSILKTINRGASLVKQLLTFARKSDVKVELVAMNEIIRETIKLIAETFPKTIVIDTHLSNSLPDIMADATQMHQVILNLCVNARDALPGGGTLKIKTNRVENLVVLSKHRDAGAREYVEVLVEDTGVGMDEATKQRIFEPFFTTKGVGSGTGLGLSLVYSIVENHLGFIDVDTAPGTGTTFSCYFPVPEQMTEIERLRREESSVPEGGHETILLIEDEELLAETVRVYLVSQGYTVLTASDGKSGVEEYVRHLETIDVVVSDLGLPLLAGDEVVRRIRSLNSKAHIILASGFIDPSVRAEMSNMGVKSFVHKPYAPDKLLQAIRRILDES